MAKSASIAFIVLIAVASIAAKPVRQRQAKYNSQAVPSALDMAMTCDQWMDQKMIENNMSMDDLATAIVEPKHRDLALEFLLFCMMDDTPMEERQSVLQDEIQKASDSVDMF